MSAAVIVLLTFLVSIVPVIELKGAIPMGVLWAAGSGLTLNPWVYFVAAYIGSCLPCIIILLFLKPVLKYLGQTKLFGGLSRRLDARFEKKSQRIKDKADKKAAADCEKLNIKLSADGTCSDEDKVKLEKLHRRRERTVEIVKYLSIFTFVAIPLPLTGVWTGSAIAVFAGTKLPKALPVILLGNLVAGLIMMLVTLLGGSAIFGFRF